MSVENAQIADDDTREKLLAAARAQFAERGFHGASIARIAGEVGLTKQALLYHFKRKEDLYAEVLRRMSVTVLEAMQQGQGSDTTPAEQFENTVMALYDAALANPLGSKVLFREMLDNQRRDTPPDQWFHKSWLDEMIVRLGRVEGMGALSWAEKLAKVLVLISAVEFFRASDQVLTRFYGAADFGRVVEVYPAELRAQVRRVIGAA